jgi:triosephosphate isomerase (TIM)
MTAKRLFLVGNWKLNHTKKSAEDFLAHFLPHYESFPHVTVAIAPVAPHLDFFAHQIFEKSLKLGAQNVFYASSGAYTGEYSAEQLAELGVSLVIVGHSERRQIFHETDEDVKKKAAACLRARIKPIICVGESAHDRASNQTLEIVSGQVNCALGAFREQDVSNGVYLAYEPVWAIGTGKAATLDEIQEVHEAIRSLIKKALGADAAKSSFLLYGGSVSAQNLKEIASLSDVDGALVGGASLQAESFLSMVKTLGQIQACRD